MEASKDHQFFLLALGVLCSGFLVLMALPKSWEASVQQNEDGSYSLSKARQEAIDQKKERILQHELYMLVASQDGKYLCKHCLNRRFHLNKGEIYRYGTTGYGSSGRGYTHDWLAENKLSYIRISIGDEANMKIIEAELIGSYPLHPDNMRRPLLKGSNATKEWYRLSLPPGNNSLN